MTTIPPEYQAEEKEPPFFDLNEKPRVPSLLSLGTIRCATGDNYKAISCSRCNRCLVEQHLSPFVDWMKQVDAVWIHEILMCFVDVMAVKTARWILDIIKLQTDYMGMEGIRRDIQEKVIHQSEVVLPKNPSPASVQRLVKSVEETVDWFEQSDELNQQLFMIRCLLLQDYTTLLWFYLELMEQVKTREPAEPEKPPVLVKGKTPVPNKSKIEAPPVVTPGPVVVEVKAPETVFGQPNPKYRGSVALDLDGVGFVSLEERNVFCGEFEHFRLCKSEGNIPVTARCGDSGMSGIYFKVQHHISVYNVYTKKISETITLKPETTPVLHMSLTGDGTFIFLQVTPSLVHIYQRIPPKFTFTKQISMGLEESISLMEISPTDQLILATRSASIHMYQREDAYTTPRTYTLADNLWSPHSSLIYSISFPLHPTDWFTVSIGTGSVVIVATPSGRIRKLLTATNKPRPVRFLHSDPFFCVGAMETAAHVWEISGPRGIARHVMSHGMEIRGLGVRYNRLITGCKDRTFRVWSVITGQLMRIMLPFPEMAHPLGRCEVVGLDVLVVTVITGVYVVRFTAMEWEENGPVMFSCDKKTINEDNCIFIPTSKESDPVATKSSPHPDAKWRQRLIKLLNHRNIKITQHPIKPAYASKTKPHVKTVGVVNQHLLKPPILEILTEEAARALGKKGQAVDFASEFNTKQNSSMVKHSAGNAAGLPELGKLQLGTMEGDRKMELLTDPIDIENWKNSTAASNGAATNKPVTEKVKKNK